MEAMMNRLLALLISSLAMACAVAQSHTITRAESQKSTAGHAEYFTGSVRVDPLFPAREGWPSGGSVSFEPGARSAWHTHPAGQVLVVTAGEGRTQSWGGPVEVIRAGDVVHCPPGVKHWHGAAPNSRMTHIALTQPRDGTNVEWMEKVSDAQYAAAPAAAAPAPTQDVAKKLFGDVAPKLADLTDNVLFGDVWARPNLSQRDRSLVTVSALIALNRPEQLRSHMARARTNGLSEDELIETLTHLAFYAGWPNAINAANVAREVFNQKPAGR
jgi:4-carboxymuconolactone decarboxylase